MSKVAVAVKIRVKAGQRDAMTAAVQPGLATAQGEAGTLTYLFHHDLVDENVVWFYELYEDDAASQAHMTSASFATWSKSLAPFIDGAPEMSFLKPVGGKGL